jgi:hypothetical protein
VMPQEPLIPPPPYGNPPLIPQPYPGAPEGFFGQPHVREELWRAGLTGGPDAVLRRGEELVQNASFDAMRQSAMYAAADSRRVWQGTYPATATTYRSTAVPGASKWGSGFSEPVPVSHYSSRSSSDTGVSVGGGGGGISSIGGGILALIVTAILCVPPWWYRETHTANSAWNTGNGVLDAAVGLWSWAALLGIFGVCYGLSKIFSGLAKLCRPNSRS